ncbi:flagellar hook-associated protein FlgL [Gottfriedia luciferensis]|uniref:flagellar hook-associated protein FlgL n=1 Tax=Gottfriedia luciferensis TaxID=178774 RepID=UPI000B4442BD|nr:flagellar hook-associated protein FlgL [Gottfriedia luciferensis]
MRVTQTMISNNMLRNLGNSYSKLDKYNDQLASGKKISRPSDDPVIAMKGIYYRSDVTQVEQYKRNLSEGYSWIESSDDSLDKVTQALQRMRELAVNGGNEANSASSRQALAAEVKQLIGHIGSLANTQVGDKYIFNGLDTNKQPVDMTVTTAADGQISLSGTYPTSTTYKPFDMQVSKGVNVPINADPDNIFDITTLNKLVSLHNGLQTDKTADIEAGIADLDNILKSVLDARTKIGATQNRIEMIDDRLGTQEIIANRIMSDNEDANIEKVITDLKTQESVHNAALGVGARIIQPTLLDFLR